MIIFKSYITREYIKQNPDKLFIFGDNDKRIGNGGQAKEMRGELNSSGIRVKKLPGLDKKAYYNDSEYFDNISKILEDFEAVFDSLRNGVDVVIPSDGIGTGLAMLEIEAPLTLKFIENLILLLAEKCGYIGEFYVHN